MTRTVLKQGIGFTGDIFTVKEHWGRYLERINLKKREMIL
jgi:hypothetical protein